MARYKPYSYEQMQFIPVCLKDQLLPGTLEYTIHRLIENNVDMSIFDDNYKNDETGRRAYDPKILLKAVLLAEARGKLSSRKIEAACVENIVFMALTCGQAPDHSTIAAFVSSMQDEIRRVFLDILLYCDKNGLLGGTTFSVDGCKLPSNASKEQSGTIEEFENRKQRLEKRLAELTLELQENDDKDEPTLEPHDNNNQDARPGEPATNDAEIEPALELEENNTSTDPSVELLENKAETELSDERIKKAAKITKLEKRIQKLDEFLAAHQPKIGSKGKEIKSNVTDNDSNLMLTSHGVIQGYNGQVVVDSKNQIIVHPFVSTSGQDDENLPPAIDGTKANLKAIGRDDDCLKNADFLGDANYFSPTNLKKLHEEHINAYIPDTDFRRRDPRLNGDEHETKFSIADFRYDEDADVYICPAGETLKRGADGNRNGKKYYRHYAADEGKCTHCAFKHRCLMQKNARRRCLSVYYDKKVTAYARDIVAKIDTDAGRATYDQRFGMVEPVFANIRFQKGMDRFQRRGHDKVTIEWILYCLVHNIEKCIQSCAKLALSPAY